VNDFRFWDGERDSQAHTRCGDVRQDSLQVADVAPVHIRGKTDGEIVDIAELNARPPGYRGVLGGHIEKDQEGGDR